MAVIGIYDTDAEVHVVSFALGESEQAYHI